jgi:Flp pilus assembly protein TadD
MESEMVAYRFGFAAAALVLVATPALAQNGAIRSAHDAITRGDYAGVERVLFAEQRIFPGNAEVLINLAAVYAGTGRAQQAAALYRQVLTRGDVLLDLNDNRTMSSHAIATTGLRRVSSLQTAAR